MEDGTYSIEAVAVDTQSQTSLPITTSVQIFY